MTVSNTLATIKTDFYGGGSLVPLVLQTGTNTNQLYLDTAGNVGIGTSTIIGSAANRGVLTLSGASSSFLTFGTGSTRWSISTFETGGVERMRIDSSGNVGIGVSSPAAKLDISGVFQFFDDTTPELRIVDSDDNNYALIGYTDGTMSLSSNHGNEAGGADVMQFLTGGSERMRIDSSGEVVITSSAAPIAPTIKHSGQTGDLAKLRIINRSGQSINKGGLLELGGITNDENTRSDIFASVAGLKANSASNNRTGYMQFSVSNGSSLSEAMRIDSAGRVGIGTSLPSAGLELNLASGDGLLINSADIATIKMKNTGGGVTNWGFATTNLAAGDFGIYASNSVGGDPITAGTPKLYFTSAGNVGIANSAPSVELALGSGGGEKLHVYDGGSVKAGFGVDLSGSSRELSMFHSTSGTNGNISFGKRLESNGAYTEAVRIDSAGNLALMTDGADIKLYYTEPRTFITNSGASVTIKQIDNNAGAAYIDFAAWDNSSLMRLMNSGNLLVGKTSNTISAAGAKLGTGGSNFTRSGEEVVYFNRTTNDGNIATFAKDGTAVGSIGASSGNLTVNSSSTGLLQTADVNRYSWDADQFYPAVDNNKNLGHPSYRFDDIYATNGTIQTSDRNEKQDIAELSDAEQRVAVAAKGLLRKFRWKDSVAEKGDEARTHFGIIAQDLQAAFAAEGLDAGDYAMFISSTWTDEETNEEKTRMGVRYSELLAFIIAAI
jgi:hypothetical protein